MSQRHSMWLKGKELGWSFYGEGEDPTISREEKSRKKICKWIDIL